MSMHDKLPDTLSDLIELALTDLAKVERSKRYTVDMGWWVKPEGATCHVCLAGAVMTKTLKVATQKTVYPQKTKYPRKLYALDYVRRGDIFEAFRTLQRPKPQAILDRIDVPDYHEDRAGFKRALRKLVRLLREHGE